MAARQARNTAGISDEVVRARTGRTGAGWCRVLDTAGARQMPHREIAAWILTHHLEVGGWWAQMTTVGYEQARGLRARHERPDGSAVSRSKTVAVPVAALYRAWHDARVRRRWLPEPGLTVRRTTAERSMRITWVDGKTSLEVNFQARGPAKSQVTVQHPRLASAREADEQKTCRRERLAALEG